ncbi:MAG: YbaK/EbsC family protein [Woeseiaceae bacterium]|nr:YbaK/EbsC family protein [Woeseiaceae bacterium]
MNDKTSDSVKRVQAFLAEQHAELVVQSLSNTTRTAAEAAATLGCEEAQIAKSLVFRDEATDEAVLVVASGANRVSTEKIRRETGVSLGRANAAFVREKTGFAIGGIPPFAHTTTLRTFLDPDLKRFESVWAAAGTPFAVLEITPDELERLADASWVELAE